MKPKVLITGAAGYLGSVVMERLHAELLSDKITALVGLDLRAVPEQRRLSGAHYYEMDIRDPKLGEVLTKHGIDTVLHLAAVIDSGSLPRQVQYDIDVLGTRNCLQAAAGAGVRRFVMTSSGAAYGYHADNPQWLREEDPLRGNQAFAYSYHKRLAEEAMAEYRVGQPQMQQVVFRVGTILGATTNNLITRLFEKKAILGIRGFESPFVFVWDQDVADCIAGSVHGERGGIYNLAGDGALPNREIARILGKRYRELPAGLLRWALRIGKPLGLSNYGPDQLLYLQYRPLLDNTKLKTEFGFTPQKNTLETFLYFLEKRPLPIATREGRLIYPDRK